MLVHRLFPIVTATIVLLSACNKATPPVTSDAPVNATATEKPTSPPTLGSELAGKKLADDANPPSAILEGIQNPALSSMYETARQAAERNPNDVNVRLQLINLTQMIGFERVRGDESEKGYEAFIAAGSEAREFLKSDPDLPDQAHAVLATVFYNEACAHSRKQNVKQALVSLEDAIEWGFSDMNTLETDEDLAAVRSQPDFASRREAWEKAAEERLIQRAKSELADAPSFPFDFNLTTVEGNPIKLADFRGKTVIVDIWGTWCPPCRAEIPSFIKLQETYGDQGLQIVGLNQEDGSPEEIIEKIKSFMEENGMNYPCAVIDEATLNQVPNFEGFPTTLFIDHTGKVRLKVVGLHEYAYLEGIVKTLLAESTSSGERKT